MAWQPVACNYSTEENCMLVCVCLGELYLFVCLWSHGEDLKHVYLCCHLLHIVKPIKLHSSYLWVSWWGYTARPNTGEFQHNMNSVTQNALCSVRGCDPKITWPCLHPGSPHLLTFFVRCAVWSQRFGHKQFICFSVLLKPWGEEYVGLLSPCWCLDSAAC